MTSRDHFLHDLPASGLQWALAGSRQEPHAFVFVTAINNIHAVACKRVMERRAAVLDDKPKECFPPRVVDVLEDLFTQLFELLSADRSNRFGDGFTALFVQIFKIEFFDRLLGARRYFLTKPSRAAYPTLVLFEIGRGCGK
jgi:hypothetical protein